MARTRGGGKATGAKAMKKTGGSPIPKAPAHKSGKKKYGGGSSYVPRATPAWQKQITTFVMDPLKCKKSVLSAAAGSAKDLENRLSGDDDGAIPGSSTQISGPVSSVYEEKNGNIEVEMDAQYVSSDYGEVATPGSSSQIYGPVSSAHEEKNGNIEVEMDAKLTGESGVAKPDSSDLLPVPVSLAQREVGCEAEVWLTGESGVAKAGSSDVLPVPVSLVEVEVGCEAEVGLLLGEGSAVDEK